MGMGKRVVSFLILGSRFLSVLTGVLNYSEHPFGFFSIFPRLSQPLMIPLRFVMQYMLSRLHYAILLKCFNTNTNKSRQVTTLVKL